MPICKQVFACLWVCLAASLIAPVSAKTVAQKAPATTRAAPGAAAPSPAVPGDAVLDILIRRTLLTLNDANLSGNYTVLRDLAAPGFRQANDAARLGEIFAKLRRDNIDLAPLVRIMPKLTRKPEIVACGMLRVSGFFPTRPHQVNFDMLFQSVEGQWRVFGLAVNTVPVASGTDGAPAKKP